MRRLVIGLFVAAVVGVLFVVLCTYVKRPYETVLLNRFGNLIQEQGQTRIAYGWYLKLPWDTVVRMDRRIHLFPNTLQQVPTAGKETISVRAFAAWRIKDPVKFYQTTSASDTKAQQLLSQKISGLVQARISSHSLDQLFNSDEKKVQTGEIEQQVARDVDAAVADQGLQIVQIGFSRMAFPPNNAEAVYQRMAAEREQDARRFQSEGDAEATRIVAEGDAQAAIIRSGAIGEAEKIKGEGDAEALKLLQGVQTSASSQEFYRFWKSMEVMKASFTKNTYLVLPTDTPWLKALFTSPQVPANGAADGSATRPSGARIGMGPSASPAGK
jgi:membrane protease subunit HflC